MRNNGNGRKVDAGLPVASVYSSEPGRQFGDRKKKTCEGAVVALEVHGAACVKPGASRDPLMEPEL